MNIIAPQRPSFFWPVILSILLVHLPLIYLLLFADWQTPKMDLFAKPEVKQVPVMLNLQNLQLIDQAPPKTEQIPDQASAIGEYNVKADVETVAPSNQNPIPQSMVQSTPQSSVAKQKQTAKAEVPKSKVVDAEPNQSQKPLEESTSPKSLKDVLAKLDAKQKTDEHKIDSLVNQPQVSDSDFKSSLEPSGDYVPFYKVGGKTYVNALAYPHVGYYVAMKRKFRTAWNPFPSLRGNRALLPPHQIESVWGYTIDKTGRIVDMTLIQSSPIAGYDQEAKRTIMSSAPFAPPPEELLKGQSVLDVSWEFRVYY